VRNYSGSLKFPSSRNGCTVVDLQAPRPRATTGESAGRLGIFLRPCRPGARASRGSIPILWKKTFRKRHTRMNKICLGRASPRCAGYFWRAVSPAFAIARARARATSVFRQSAHAATAPGRTRDGWQLRGPGRVHRHQYRPKNHQRERRREPGHSHDRARPGTNGTVINGPLSTAPSTRPMLRRRAPSAP
jgi:hypothetical protein